MSKNIYGGGSQTNINGLAFEQETALRDSLLKISGYTIQNNKIYFNEKYVGITAGKNNLYKILLEPRGINYKTILSKKLLPDEAVYIEEIKTVFIIEKKFQNSAGSVDEKLQTCDFKKKQYTKLFTPLDISVEYIYVLNDWFKKNQYTDVLNYIRECDCHYYFNEIPLDFLQLPHIS